MWHAWYGRPKGSTAGRFLPSMAHDWYYFLAVGTAAALTRAIIQHESAIWIYNVNLLGLRRGHFFCNCRLQHRLREAAAYNNLAGFVGRCMSELTCTYTCTPRWCSYCSTLFLDGFCRDRFMSLRWCRFIYSSTWIPKDLQSEQT